MTATEPTTPPATAPTPPKRRRRGAALGDMTRSLGLMAVVVGVVLLTVPSLFHPDKGDRFAGIDDTSYLSGFRQVTGVAPLVPTGLGHGWLTTAGSVHGGTRDGRLHLGFATPGGHYAGLDEGVGLGPAVVGSVLGQRGMTSHGTQRLVLPGRGSVSWELRTASAGEAALSMSVGRLTVVITGSATPTEMDQLATSLRERRR